MTKAKRHVFLSPHPDDVVWASGGRIRRLVESGAKVLVITVFDGDSSAARHSAWLSDAWRKIANPASRRLENQKALQFLGVEGLSLGYVDAALRHEADMPVYTKPEEMFTGSVEGERALLTRLTEQLQSITEEGDHVHIPLALSGHIDHRLVYESAKSARGEAYWYEEFGYPPSTPLGLVASFANIDIGQWVSSALLYRSQVLMLFGGVNAFKQALLQHATQYRYGKNAVIDIAATGDGEFLECYWH